MFHSVTFSYYKFIYSDEFRVFRLGVIIDEIDINEKSQNLEN